MRKNTTFIFKLFLAIADIVAIVASFTLAYWVRVNLDDRPFTFAADTKTFAWTMVLLIPLWLTILTVCGLYRKSVYLYRPKEYGRLLLVSLISMMALLTTSFFWGIELFPARAIALYFVIISFVLLLVARGLVKVIYHLLYKLGIGCQKVLIVGDNPATTELAAYIMKSVAYGYRVVGIVAKSKYLPVNGESLHFASFEAAVKKVNPDIIMQTGGSHSEKVYLYSVEHHIGYMFVPEQDILLSRTSDIEIIGTQPVIDVKLTRLVGSGRFVKRFLDIVLGLLTLIISLPIWALIIIIMKISDPRASVFFRQTRLTRFNRQFKALKFRTHKSQYNGLSPEQAFAKMGRPELSKVYRDNGDQLPGGDPRVSRFGRFLRATSLDELPQLINVIKGDLSLVGPRALVPFELNKYPKKNLILAVRSGITGLAQVSGRRDISFDERRRLDTYYVQHWSLLLDLQILLKTIVYVLLRRGAK